MSEYVLRPDLLIAIDFGMTCTGVAYCNVSTGEETVRWIQKWPGRANAVENKCPTVLVYPKDSSTPSSWGFLAESPTEQMSETKDCKEWFKVFLDETKLQQAQQNPHTQGIFPASIQEVERLYCDYFRFLYQTIQQKLRGELASRWEDANIEFIFSVPTTWKPVPTVERFRSCVERAGFGRSPSHKVEIGLTEAEAAAVHTARVFPKLFNERDVLVVCDVGGGTTDLSALRVSNTGGDKNLSLEQMDTVQGANVGSVQIDSAFENAVRERLEAADRSMPLGLDSKQLDDIAWEMAKSKEYQNAKCDYGSQDGDTEFFTVAIPKLHHGYRHKATGIFNGEMRFTRTDLQGHFDTQFDKLFELIDNQIKRLGSKYPQDQVAHLVLSGGLGNSPYVQNRLRERYSYGNAAFPNARSLQVRVAPEPQLVVCKGIVSDRIAKLSTGKSILGWRCSRASYGTLCKVLYDPHDARHYGQPTERDSLDGKLYIPNVVEWIIKQGEPVSMDTPKIVRFRRKCSPATHFDPNPKRVFPTAVVMCEIESDMLPYTMNSSCKKLCDIQSDFSSLPLTLFKMKNRHWWNIGEKYHRIDYVVKVAIGPADISFELWHNGQRFSKDNTIKVEWSSASAPTYPAANGVGGNGKQWLPTHSVMK